LKRKRKNGKIDKKIDDCGRERKERDEDKIEKEDSNFYINERISKFI
jgi:hypothetical protein